MTSTHILHPIWMAIAGLILTACAGTPSPPSSPPTYQGVAPDIEREGLITHTTTAIFNAPILDARKWLDEEDRFLAAMEETDEIKKPIDTVYLHGEWPSEGAVRRVELSDGNYVLERVVENGYPTYFSYQIWNFTAPAGKHLDYALGEMVWNELPSDQSELVWSYSVRPNAGFKRPFVRRFVNRNVQPFMNNALSKIEDQGEARFPKLK